MSRLDKFFLRNLAYCTSLKHRTPLETLYSNFSQNQDNIFNEIRSILNIKDRNRLIYFFIVDKQTKDSFEAILNQFKFSEFFPYFESCMNSILDDNLNMCYLFQFVNFFHLIGSLRILQDSVDSKTQINEILLGILQSNKYPFFIKYSASQIFVCNDLANDNLYKNEILYNFYNDLIDNIENDGIFTQFIGLYSMYYNSFEVRENVIKNLCSKIILSSKIDFNRLHTYLPQIHCMLRRHYKNKFDNHINKNNCFNKLYWYNDSEYDAINMSLSNIISNI